MISPVRRLMLLGFISVIGAAGLWYVANLAGDNQRLEANLQTALSANESQQTAMRLMAEEMARQNQAVIDRDNRNRATNSRLKVAERRLRDAQKNPEITLVERECMESAIPGGVIDVLRESPHRNGSDPAGENLPSRYFLYGDGGPAVRGPHLGRSGSLRQRAAVSHSHAEPGSGSDTGFLPW